MMRRDCACREFVGACRARDPDAPARIGAGGNERYGKPRSRRQQHAVAYRRAQTAFTEHSSFEPETMSKNPYDQEPHEPKQ